MIDRFGSSTGGYSVGAVSAAAGAIIALVGLAKLRASRRPLAADAVLISAEPVHADA
jgi:hypothetical protein